MKKKDYEETCELIWGCVPVDKQWAIGTGIFKEGWKRVLEMRWEALWQHFDDYQVYLHYWINMTCLNAQIPDNAGVGKHPIYSFKEFMSPVKDLAVPNYSYKSPYHHFKATH